MSNIRDVAKLAGVSTATVSRVLNNITTYKITAATKAGVLDAAMQLGYSIEKKPTHAPLKVGCVLCVTKNKYADSYFTSILSGIEEQLKAEGLSLAFLKTLDELTDEYELYNTFTKELSSVILMETLNDETYAFIKSNVRHLVGIDIERDDIDNIGYDHFKAAAQITTYLIKQGHTKIAFVSGSGEGGDVKKTRRYAGFAATMAQHGLAVNPAWIADCQWNDTLCIEQVKQMAALPDRPSAIFAGSDFMAMAALSALYSINVNVPSQMAVMGLSDIELSKYSNPPLSTVHIPAKEIGMLAVKTILERMRGDTSPPKHILLQSALVIRDST